MSKWKKRILIAIGVLLVVAIISIPTVLLLTRMSGETTQVRQQELRLAFVERYGPEARLLEVVEPEDLYMYVWEENRESEGNLSVIRHYTLSIDGLFVELGEIELVSEE